jgi:hypothetical protein
VPAATMHWCTTITATHQPSAPANMRLSMPLLCSARWACCHSAVPSPPAPSSGGCPHRSRGRRHLPTSMQPSTLQHSIAAATSAIMSLDRPPPAPLAVPSYAACSAIAELQQNLCMAHRATQPSTPLMRSPPRHCVVVAGSPLQIRPEERRIHQPRRRSWPDRPDPGTSTPDPPTTPP